MKKPNVWMWGLGVSLAALPLVVGCLQSASSATNASVANSTNSLLTAGPVQAGATNTITEITGEDPIVNAPAKKITADIVLPPNFRSNSPTAGIIRMANSGVEEGIMLSFVTNSASTFELGPDEVIYLKDIGVPDSVVTAMMQRDVVVRLGGAAPAAIPQSQPAETNGPTHQWAEQAPAASQVAPQFEATQPAPAAEPQQPATQVTYNTFYSSLAPYGNWIELEGYGRVWQPTIVVSNPSWQPYFHGGRWINTDCGWYWMSDYTWGWAPFHYGRWFRHGYHGWCWAPDVVWGPAWVTWRQYDSYCGWAPLPPYACWSAGFGFSYYGSSVAFGFGWGLGYNCYSWVPVHNMCAYRLPHHAVPHQQVNNFFDQSTVINVTGNNNNVIVNRGIPPERVAEVTKQEVRRVQLREATEPGRLAGRRENLDAAGKTLTVYKPSIPVSNGESGIVQRMSRGEVGRNTTGSVAPAAASSFGGGKPSTPATPFVDRTTIARPQAGSVATVPRGQSASVDKAPISNPGTRKTVTPASGEVATRQSIARPERTTPGRVTTPPTPQSQASTPPNPAVRTEVAPSQDAASRGSASLVRPDRPTTRPSNNTGTVDAGGQRAVPAGGTTTAGNRPTTRSSGFSDRPPTRPAPAVSTPAPAPAPIPAQPSSRLTQSRPETRSSGWSRPDTSRPAAAPTGSPTPVAPTYRSEPRPSAPAVTPAPPPVQRSAPPTYQAPVRSAPVEAPRFSAPAAPAPRAPSYNAPSPAPAPRAQPSAPAMAPSQPQRSSGSSFSPSSGNGRSGFARGRD